MKKIFLLFVCFILVLTSHSQLTSEEITNEKVKKEKPKSSNWISFSAGTSQKNFFFNQQNLSWNNRFNSNPRVLVSEINYSHRHFLSPNNFLSYDFGIYLLSRQMTYSYDRYGNLLSSGTISFISGSGGLLYNFQFNRFSINTGFGLNHIGIQRKKNIFHNELFVTKNGESITSTTSYKFIAGQRELRKAFNFPKDFISFFGVIGLNMNLNKNNELGIRINYHPQIYYPNALSYQRGYDYVSPRFIFQLKFNHRL